MEIELSLGEKWFLMSSGLTSIDGIPTFCAYFAT